MTQYEQEYDALQRIHTKRIVNMICNSVFKYINLRESKTFMQVNSLMEKKSEKLRMGIFS